MDRVRSTVRSWTALDFSEFAGAIIGRYVPAPGTFYESALSAAGLNPAYVVHGACTGGSARATQWPNIVSHWSFEDGRKT